MLVLTRLTDEEIVIAGGTIVIKVLGVRCGKVRIGISAPKDIDVNRREIYDAIQAERDIIESAAGSPVAAVGAVCGVVG